MVRKQSPTSYRIDADLLEPTDIWLRENNMKMSTLLNQAVREYITKEHVLEPVEIRKISSKEYRSSMNRMIKKHKSTLDKLK